MNANFRCLNCGLEIGFNKPGTGQPSALKVAGVWAAPREPEQWLGPCEASVMRALHAGKLKKNILELA